MDDVDEIVREFVLESSENLDQLDRDLLALERQPDSPERLASAFRAIHTIKGTSGFLAYNRLERLTHTGESLLALLRDGGRAMDTATADALMRMVDTVRAMLATIDAAGTEGDAEIDAEIDAVMEQLTAQMRGTAGASEPVGQHESSRRTKPPPRSAAAERGRPAPHPAAGTAPHPARRRPVAESTLRVDIDLLDALMRLAGELVLTRNQLVRGAGALADPSLSRATQRLSAITASLQDVVMRTRMQPIEHLWAKLPRLVRDLGAQCGRQVRLEMVGRDTELDRAQLEAISDPLTHLVRNCMDHGIEAPDVREAAGKPREGVLSLRAYDSDGQVVIEVGDDGAGIDPALIVARATERGLRTPAELAGASDDDIVRLVFEPGFSTASTVTEVSGRGVGMDVVKTNLAAIGGTIEIESAPGVGTLCRMRVPLTLAIVPALIFDCDGQRYAVEQAGVLELVTLGAGRCRAGIEHVAGAPVYRWRGELLPLVSLRALFAGTPPAAGSAPAGTDLIVVQAAGRRFGLLVDRVLDTEEVVVKALGPRLKEIGVYSGATVLGDGTVALIVDPLGLASRVLRSEIAVRAVASHPAAAAPGQRGSTGLLVVGAGRGSRVAIPLSAVLRLEVLSADRVGRVGGREVIEHRGRIMPLLWLDRHLGLGRTGRPTEIPVAVCSHAGATAAIAVHEITDIVEHAGAMHDEVGAPGLAGSVVIDGRIVGLLDLEQAMRAAGADVDARRGPVGRAGSGEPAGADPNGGVVAPAGKGFAAERSGLVGAGLR